ncbi:unnamed protein product [Somion occarium]|uniref:Secreted protein n=1 Tax=Somion occarium TaxID=3059160 RepID=A0ABP1DHE4_9APHY
MTSTPGNALIVTIHAVYALTGLCKYKFVYTFLADLAVETVCMTLQQYEQSAHTGEPSESKRRNDHISGVTHTQMQPPRFRLP